MGNDEELETNALANDNNVDNDSENNDSNGTEKVKEVENSTAE